jgi:hypothetical protein
VALGESPSSARQARPTSWPPRPRPASTRLRTPPPPRDVTAVTPVSYPRFDELGDPALPEPTGPALPGRTVRGPTTASISRILISRHLVGRDSMQETTAGWDAHCRASPRCQAPRFWHESEIRRLRCFEVGLPSPVLLLAFEQGAHMPVMIWRRPLQGPPTPPPRCMRSAGCAAGAHDAA